ncbi:hypothetical protein [Tabrizicola sp. BL-A-41-H6]|uniref:hypothetical protein n=1 Tax=Tabrizicola sp. BL-A-41-H6 TaxID=3421107 RepID=UPI003D67D9CD
MIKYLFIAFVLLFSSASASVAETADAAANALIVAASRDVAAAQSLDEPGVADLMTRLTLITSARAAVREVLQKHQTTALAVRIALGEIPELSLESLDAAIEEARITLAQGITSCSDRRACVLNLAEGIANDLGDFKSQSQAFASIAIGLRDAARAPALISFIESRSTLSQSQLDYQTAKLLLEIAHVLAIDGQVETAVSVVESIPESERSFMLRMFATFLLDLDNFDAAARLVDHPSLSVSDRDELAGDLMIFNARIGDADATVYWLERMGVSADFQLKEAAEAASLSGDASLSSFIIAAMPAGLHKMSAEIWAAGAARDIHRLRTLVDEISTLDTTAKENMSINLAAQFYFLGDNAMGDHLSQLANKQDDVQRKLVDLYIQTDQIGSAIDAAEKSGSQLDTAIAAISVGILAMDGLAAAEQFIENQGSPVYSLTQVFDSLKAKGRLAEAVEFGESDSYLADRAIYLSAIDVDRHDTLEAELLRVLGIRDRKIMVGALAALAYKFDL